MRPKYLQNTVLSVGCKTILKRMAAVGFEPTPPKRLVPKTRALDRSATLPFTRSISSCSASWLQAVHSKATRFQHVQSSFTTPWLPLLFFKKGHCNQYVAFISTHSFPHCSYFLSVDAYFFFFLSVTAFLSFFSFPFTIKIPNGRTISKWLWIFHWLGN